MDSHISYTLRLLVVFSLLCLQSKADGSGSVLFLDSPKHQYLRPHAEINSMELHEVGAAMSVLLGFAPPATLSAASSSKLNDVLMPNPFDRPRAVFVLEVTGVEDSSVVVDSDKAFGSALKSKVTFGSAKAEMQVPDENGISVFSLNEASSSDAECSDKDLSDFTSMLGGSYVNGELIIPLRNGAHISLHMSKKADRAFATNLVSLVRNVQKAIEMHQDLSGNVHKPAELITGIFSGIEILQEQYGTEGVAQKGVELLFASISKIFDHLQEAYTGEIVGVMLFGEAYPSESQTKFSLMSTSRTSARSMEETKESPDPTLIIEVLLVRRVLAWITGIILLIATLLGIYFLMNMPITRDTLLYSNVKLD